MASWFLPLVCSVALLGQVEGQGVELKVDEATRRSIRAAVRNLSSRDFNTRTAATKFLWRQGLKAQPALQQALKNADGETRLRARRLLRDFEYGILPTVTEEMRTLIRRFRDGPAAEQQQAFKQLLDKEEYKTIERLIRLQKQPDFRRALLNQLVQHPKAVAGFVELDRIQSLLDVVGADQDPEWRTTVSIQLMFAPKVLEHLAEKKQLGQVLKLIQDERQARLRSQMLTQLFGNSATVALIVDQKQLDILLTALKAEPDKRLRGQLLSTLVANNTAAQKIVEQGMISELTKFAEQHISPEVRHLVFRRLVQSPAIAKSLLKDDGIDGMIKFVSREKDAATRGQLMAAAVASSAIRNRVRGRALGALVSEVARREKDAAGRREFLYSFLSSNNVIYSFSDTASLLMVWQLVRDEDDRAWQARTIPMLMRSYRANTLLADKKEAAWVFELLQDKAAEPVRHELLTLLVNNQQTVGVLVGQGQLEAMLKLVKAQPDRTRPVIMRNLLRNPAVAQELIAKKKLDLLITLVNEEKDGATRVACLQGVFGNYTAMASLMQGGHFDTLHSLAKTEADPQRRGTLLGSFINGSGVLEEIARRGPGLLLEYANMEDAGGRRQYRLLMFQNQKAVNLLMAEGYFDELLAVAKQDGADFLDELLGAAKVIEHLTAKGEFKPILDLAMTSGDENTRRQLLQRLLGTQQIVKTLIGTKKFEHVFALVKNDPDPRRRASLISSALSSRDVVRYFAKNDQLGSIFELIDQEEDPNARNQILYYLTNRSDSVALLVEFDRLDEMLRAIKEYAEGRSRGDLMARVLMNRKTLQKLKTDQRVELLLSFLRSKDEKQEATQGYINALFSNDTAMAMLLADNYFPPLLAMARQQSEDRRGEVMGRLVASRQVARHLRAVGTLNILVELVQQEKNESVRTGCLRGVFGNYEAMPALFRDGYYKTLRGLIDQQKDPVQRAALFGDFLNANSAVNELANNGELDLVFKYAESENGVARQQFRARMFRNRQVLTRLVDKGHFEKLASIAKQDDGAFLDELLVVPNVIQRLIAAKEFDVLLKAATEQADEHARRSLLQGILRSTSVLQQLVASDQIETVLRLVKEEREPYWRSSLLSPILSSPEVIKYFGKEDKLDSFFDLVVSSTRSSSYNQVLSSLVGRSEPIRALLEYDCLEDVIECIKSQSSGHAEGSLLGGLMTNSATLQWLKTNKKVDLLLTSAENDDALARQTYLSRILSYTTSSEVLIAAGQFETIVATVKAQPDNTRGAVLRSLLANRAVAQHLAKAKKVESLMALAKGDGNPLVRQAGWSGLFSNYTAMPLLLEAGHYGTFRKEIDAVDDPVQRRALFGDFLNGRNVLKVVVKQGETDLLLQFARSDNREAQKQFLSRLFRNRDAIGLLIDNGHYAQLVSFAEQENAALMDEFLAVPQVIKHLADTKQFDVFTTFVSKSADDNTRRNVLQQVIHNEQSLSAIVKGGHFDAFFQLIKAETEPSYRGSMLGYAVASPVVIRYFVQAKRLKELVEAVRSDTSARDRVASNILNRTDTITLFIDNDALDALLAIVGQHSDDRTRGQLIGRVLTSSKTVQKLAAQKKLSRLLSVSGELGNAGAIQGYFDIVLASSQVVNLLLDGGYYEALFKLATSPPGAPDPAATRSRRVSLLFANGKAVTQLLKSKQLPELILFAEETRDAEHRRAYLTTFFSNEQLVAAIVEQGVFGKLMALCMAEPDERLRNRNLTTLLLSPRAIDQLEDDELTNVVKLAVDEPDGGHRQAFLSKLFTRRDAISRLIATGHFDTLFAAIDKDLNASRRYSFLSSLVGNQAATTHLAKANVLMKLIDGVVDDNQRASLLQRVLYNRATIKHLLAAGHLPAIFKHVESIPHPSARRSMLGTVLAMPATVEHLAKQDKLDFLFETLDEKEHRDLRQRCLQTFIYYREGQRVLTEGKIADQFVALMKKTEDRYRRGYLIGFINNPMIRQSWVALGKADKLKELAALIPDDANREMQLRNILYSPSGMLGHLLSNRELGQARQLLRDDESDYAKVLLAAHLALEGRLDDEIESVQERFDKQENAQDARWLAYLFRAKGDLAAAGEMADVVGDPRLLRPLAVERRDWSGAAGLQASSMCLPPVRVSYLATSDQQRRVEQLGLTAAYQRLSGQMAEFEQTIAEIQEFARQHKDSKELGWNCAEVLLLNDRIEMGLELAARTKPIKAFNLYLARHEYGKALAVMGWKRGTSIDRDWYDALPAAGPNAGQVAVARFESAIHAARVLRFVGEREAFETIMRLLDELAMQASSSGSFPRRDNYLEYLSAGLYRMGLTERAFAVGARTVQPASSSPNVLNQLFDSNESRHWWAVLKAETPLEPAEDRLMRLQRILRPAPGQSPEMSDALLEQAMQYGATITSSRSKADYWYAIGSTCKRLGRTAAAKACFAKVPDHVPALRAWANILAAEQRWEAAAQQYEKAWEQDHQQVGALYLSGDALIRCGQEDRGRQLMQQADRLAVQESARHSLALDLYNRGLQDEAIARWKQLLRLGPFETWYVNDASRRLGDGSLVGDPGRAADLWQHYLLGDFRVVFRFNEDKSYLRMPYLIHRMRALAAIEAQDWEAAGRHIDSAVEALPGETALAEELVPLLDQLERPEEADRLASRIINHFRAGTDRHPGSAFHHNNLAWAAARSHRQLDLAMQHANKAVELEPDNGSYVDTLAEVYFHLGDRDKAVELSQRAVKLRPTATLRKQLERFRNDPLPATKEELQPAAP